MIFAPAITGPTASGKTALSLHLARELGCEIISCDSMQIYKRMDIGTAKATAEERAVCPHHMIDFLSPTRCKKFSQASIARRIIYHTVSQLNYTAHHAILWSVYLRVYSVFSI